MSDLNMLSIYFNNSIYWKRGGITYEEREFSWYQQGGHNPDTTNAVIYPEIPLEDLVKAFDVVRVVASAIWGADYSEQYFLSTTPVDIEFNSKILDATWFRLSEHSSDEAVQATLEYLDLIGQLHSDITDEE